MIKTELIQAIDQLASEYLGVTKTNIAPKSWPKQRLRAMHEAFELMVNYQNAAREIKAQYSVSQWEVMALGVRDEQEEVDWQRFQELTAQAGQIWHREF